MTHRWNDDELLAPKMNRAPARPGLARAVGLAATVVALGGGCGDSMTPPEDSGSPLDAGIVPPMPPPMPMPEDAGIVPPMPMPEDAGIVSPMPPPMPPPRVDAGPPEEPDSGAIPPMPPPPPPMPAP